MKDISFKEKTLVVGIGSALVDILIHEDDDFVAKTNGAKGGMILVDNEVIDTILSRATGEPAIVPGGSACNTVTGIAKLGGRSRFIGKCGTDHFGHLIATNLEKNAVEPLLFSCGSPTGKVLSIITPDAQRTMFTFLGAAAETTPEELPTRGFENAAIVHIEGYLLHNRELILTAFKEAKNAQAFISLDLASYTVVEESRDFLMDIVASYVDILIANEDEARVFTGHSNEAAAIESLSKMAMIAVLKIGKRGSYISHRDRIYKIPASGTEEAKDTTGAGDLWASGFLFGLVNNLSLEKCGMLGSACGYEVCQVIGTSIPETGWQRIRQLI